MGISGSAISVLGMVAEETVILNLRRRNFFTSRYQLANSACVKYENCKQKPDETVESYFLRLSLPTVTFVRDHEDNKGVCDL